MRNILVLMLVFSILPISSFAYNSKLKITANLKKQCSNQGGIWHEFSDNCADLCSAKFKKLICARSSLKLSCECIVTNECWNDKINKCQSYDDYKPYHEEYLEQSKIAVRKIREKIMTKIKKDQKNDKEIIGSEKLGVYYKKNLKDKNTQQNSDVSTKPKEKKKFINAN
jgi:hypothetical protein